MLSSVIRAKLAEERKSNHPWVTNWRDLMQSSVRLYDMLAHMMEVWCRLPLTLGQLTVSYLPLFTMEYTISLDSSMSRSGSYQLQNDVLVCANDSSGFLYDDADKITPVKLGARILCPDTGFFDAPQPGYISTTLVVRPMPEMISLSRDRTTVSSWTSNDVSAGYVQVVTKGKPFSRNGKIVSMQFTDPVEALVFKHAI